MGVLEHLEPYSVFRYFEEISAIPHGSGNTKKISNYLVEFAKQHGLEYYQDALQNVIIIKPATAGYENAAPVILQGHMDMVCEKAPDCTKNMETEGLDLAVEGDTIYAKGTTLGGDDGIAVAMALAVLDAEDLPHPRVEAVFTVDEETGMEGAMGLDVSPLQGKRMLNIDSEEEGVFTVSCAGGVVSCCTLPLQRETLEAEGMTVTVSGLAGGHSGVEIHKHRANANMLLGRVLAAVSERTEIRIHSVNGGLKDNAIPVKAQAVLIAADSSAAMDVICEMENVFRREYASADGAISVTASPCSVSGPVDAASTQKILCMLLNLPNGIQEMSADIPGLVQTSLNLGILKTEESAVHASFCVRSSIETQKQMLMQRLEFFMRQLGGSVRHTGNYPGWQYQPDSALRELMTEVYTGQYGCPPKVEAIHAGVECGLFAGKIPGLECVSFGPDLTDIHTFREKMHIASVQRVWNMMTEILKRMET